MQTASLSEPQVAFLSRAMRNGEVRPFGSTWRTADALGRLGFVEMNRLGCRVITRSGLEALRDFRAAQYAKSGSFATIKRLEEVEAALAEQES